MNENLYALIAARFPADLDACAVETHDARYWTWSDLDRATGRIANLLASLKLPAGSRIAVQVDKSVEALCLYLATLRAGHVFLPLNSAYQQAEIDYFVENAEPAVVVCTPGNRGWIEPIAKAYEAVTPSFVRDSVQSFMRNLKEPIVVANNLLQADFGGAGQAGARFVVNSTVGVLGLVDVASTKGLNYEREDFGQTLATWGLGDGFYIVLPILGPSSLRDTAGLAVDTLADPVRLATRDPNREWIYYTRTAVEVIDTRARLLAAVEDLRRNSLDYYAAVRSAYVQKRASLIKKDTTGTGHNAYDDFEAQ
jgi:phospholipid-binding lipoprotein MlaA